MKVPVTKITYRNKVIKVKIQLKHYTERNFAGENLISKLVIYNASKCIYFWKRCNISWSEVKEEMCQLTKTMCINSKHVKLWDRNFHNIWKLINDEQKIWIYSTAFAKAYTNVRYGKQNSVVFLFLYFKQFTLFVYKSLIIVVENF